MLCRPITIINKLGLHARATAKLVATASDFDSTVRIRGNGREVDAKNIMQVMMLGWIMPVGLRPTCGFDIGPHIGLGLLNSGSQLARAAFRACL